MDQIRTLEHGLAQKLMMMENAAARIASIKAHLRANAEQVRKEVSNTISQHLSLIRAREQQLLIDLDGVLSSKEAVLSKQQQLLHQNIGACQQALEGVKRDGGRPDNAQQVLQKLNNMDLSPREDSRVGFEADSIGLRSIISQFGDIHTSGHHSIHTTGESLPMEMEDYEDDIGMSHKSVMRLGSAPVGNRQPQVESVKRWLTKIPSGAGALDADVSALMAEFEVIKTGSVNENSDTSSFDIVSSATSYSPEGAISAQFLDMLQRPLSDWLLHTIPPVSSEQSSLPPSRPMKRRHSVDSVGSAKKYEFEDVIRSVQQSSNSKWRLEQSDASEPETPSRISTMTTFKLPIITSQPSTSTIVNNSSKQPSQFNEEEFVGRLNQIFHKEAEKSVKSNTNQQPIPNQQIQLETIMAWKNVLDKIHANATWLAH